MIDEKLLQRLPKKYQAIVQHYEKDDDGYWLYLKDGYSLEYYSADTLIHEDTQAEVLAVLRNHLKQKVSNASGGKRKGAGRKKLNVQKIRWNVTVTPDEKEYLQKMLNAFRAKNVQKTCHSQADCNMI